MAVTINREQRDALWAELRLELSAGDNLGKFLDCGDYEYAQELRRRWEAHFALLDDLGWAECDPREVFTLTMPAEQLAHEARYHRERAAGALEDGRRDLTAPLHPRDLIHMSEQEWRDEARREIDEDLDLLSACDHVLSQLSDACKGERLVA